MFSMVFETKTLIQVTGKLTTLKSHHPMIMNVVKLEEKVHVENVRQ